MTAPQTIDAGRGGPAPAAVEGSLLGWYDRHRRKLPWRAALGARPDPYKVWLSEVMLQQTTVQTVTPYYLAFVERWPTVRALAAATLDDVLHAWQGLGYYARARNLHRCAVQIAENMDGEFPPDEAALRSLPGIGAYTAAAVAAIAFGRPAVVVDGNVERVMARLFEVGQPMPGARRRLHSLAARLTSARRPGDYAQAIMDLGATVCVPRAPRCGVCPLSAMCRARAAGTAAALPARAPRRDRPVRHGVAFWITNGEGAVLLRRRPERGLLGGMMEVPSSDWRSRRWDVERAVEMAPVSLPLPKWRKLPGMVRHTFTHFHLELQVATARLDRPGGISGVWSPVDRLSEHALPSLMKKVARHVAAHGA